VADKGLKIIMDGNEGKLKFWMAMKGLVYVSMAYKEFTQNSHSDKKKIRIWAESLWATSFSRSSRSCQAPNPSLLAYKICFVRSMDGIILVKNELQNFIIYSIEDTINVLLLTKAKVE
jgi:hypothetical protein